MTSLRAKVTRLLKQTFPPPAKVRLRDEDGIFGVIISTRFQGLDAIERINLIWDVLDANLTPEERRQVVTIIAVTPNEEIAHTS